MNGCMVYWIDGLIDPVIYAIYSVDLINKCVNVEKEKEFWVSLLNVYCIVCLRNKALFDFILFLS